MDILYLCLDILFTSAVLITSVRMYFTINKLWKRKSDQEVCDSISIFAYTLAMIVHVPYLLKFALVEKSIMPAINDGVNILSYGIILFIGSGYWVRANKRRGLFSLMKRALRMDKKESGLLVKSLIRPSGATQIIEILEKVACLDNELSDSEVNLVKDFAKNWNIKISESNLEEWRNADQTGLLDLRNKVQEYLDLSPPVKQASELMDLISLIVKADEKITSEEQLFLDESKGIINNYINQDEHPKMYEVMLVPQKKKKIQAINDIFPEAELVKRRGGKVHIQGRYYSKEFAEAICQRYIDLGIFSITSEVLPEAA